MQLSGPLKYAGVRLLSQPAKSCTGKPFHDTLAYWVDRSNRYLKLQNNRRGTPWFSKKSIDGGMVEGFEVNMAQYTVWFSVNHALEKPQTENWDRLHLTRLKYNI